jgi:hypothetical protein
MKRSENFDTASDIPVLSRGSTRRERCAPRGGSRVSLSLYFVTALVSFFATPAYAQATATLQGRVVDADDAVLVGVAVSLRNSETGRERVARTDDHGNYLAAALPVGVYRVEVRAQGFRTLVVERLAVDVSRTVVQDFRLRVGPISEEVTVAPNADSLERATISVGHVVDDKAVRELPLNGRYFLDLALLVPGTVTPPQNGFSTSPIRGSGSFAINTAGNREDSVNYLINGITLNNLWFNSINFQPSIGSIQEFKVDNSPSSMSPRGPAPTSFTASCTNFCATTRSTPAISSTSPRPSRRRSTGTSSAATSAGRSSGTGRSSSSPTKGCAIARGSTSTASS